jgi:hypothetical protein
MMTINEDQIREDMLYVTCAMMMPGGMPAINRKSLLVIPLRVCPMPMWAEHAKQPPLHCCNMTACPSHLFLSAAFCAWQILASPHLSSLF